MRFALLVLIAAAGRPVAGQATRPDPSTEEIRLPSSSGWSASLVHESDAGIWTVGAFKCFPQFGSPEVYGLDDKGRFTICVPYGGKWTPIQAIEDREWLGAVAFVDLDPRAPGPEIYTGGKRGNLYQIVPHADTTFDTKVIARFPGQELHTLVGGDLAVDREGLELLAFTSTGDVYDVRQDTASETGWSAAKVAAASGRVRDVVAIEARAGQPRRLAAACRSGELLLLTMSRAGLEARPVIREPMGLGRVARRQGAASEPFVLYVTRDDGLVLRVEEMPGASPLREVIYAGPQGPRGVAAGRFHADPAAESLAVFGYSRKVELISRIGNGPWQVDVLFEDRDRGHWLAACELDGRNATDELVGSGYGKRIFLLARPPGYGLTSVTAESRPSPR